MAMINGRFSGAKSVNARIAHARARGESPLPRFRKGEEVNSVTPFYWARRCPGIVNRAIRTEDIIAWVEDFCRPEDAVSLGVRKGRIGYSTRWDRGDLWEEGHAEQRRLARDCGRVLPSVTRPQRLSSVHPGGQIR
jgi:hypothetical protein